MPLPSIIGSMEKKGWEFIRDKLTSSFYKTTELQRQEINSGHVEGYKIQSEHRAQRIRDHNSKYIQYENSIINKLNEQQSKQYSDEKCDVTPCEAELQAHDLQDQW